MKFLGLLLTLCISISIYGQQIFHEISMPNPETHYFHIQTTLNNFKEKKITLVMPVWSPGSYLIREYPKNVNLVRAFDENNHSLNVKKVSKNKWEIEKGNAKKVIVKYESYAFNLGVRTAFLDKTHGFFNGTNVFTFPEGYKHLGGQVKVIPHADFATISAPLKIAGDGVSTDSGAKTFLFSDFDELADSPFEVGNQVVFHFDAAGVKHTVAMYGEGNYDIEILKKDMARVVEAATTIFGQNPNKEYLFIVHNTDDGDGGLEHMNSTTLNVSKWIYSKEKYRGFLSLVAHEYFHVWNVKRLRPCALVDIDYSNENYTDLLWVMEGFTSYYSEIILLRAGYHTQESYLTKLQGTLNYVEGTPGNKVQPVSHSSYDAWIKSYRPNENSRNTEVSYYSKGGLIGAVLDAMIIEKYNGKKDLSDFMQLLYQKYYATKNVGFTQTQFKEELSKFLGKNMDDFFIKYIDGVETIPYEDFMRPLGLFIERIDEVNQSIGIGYSIRSGRVVITSVLAGSEAEKAGLSVDDEIIAFNGYRVNDSNLSGFLADLSVGQPFKLWIARGERMMEITNIKMGTTTRSRYHFTYEGNKLGAFWLREMGK
ncbi:MAG: PDZ domain-containing protein [Brumimicrobium sp.]|nr:PDZ domain-containing protein [Brumimicrobium sp.]